MGTSTADIAERNPENGYIGVEVFKAGVGKLASEIRIRGLSNVRIIHHDAWDVMENMIAPGSLDGIHIFFPDPWPKKRHHKRRLINETFAPLLVKALKPGGYLFAVTDWEQYAEQMKRVLNAVGGLRLVSGRMSHDMPWRPQTHFERRGIAEHRPILELFFLRAAPEHGCRSDEQRDP